MPVVGRMRGVKVLQHRLHILTKLSGRDIFLKYAETEVKGRRESLGVSISVERKALRALQGLAVPVLLEPSTYELRRIIERPASKVIVLDRVRGRELHQLQMPLSRLIGFWCAVTEQLAAFRRRGVLYSDIKTNNVLARAWPPRVTLIDFNLICPVSTRGSYPSGFIGYTTYCAAPEQGFRSFLTEASVVYQLGMLWAQSADKRLDNSNIAGSRRFKAMRRRLARQGSPALSGLLGSCLAKRPEERPQNYEVVLARLRRAGLPVVALRVWSRLRAPYAEALRELGFEGPETLERTPRAGNGKSSGARRRSSR